MRTPPPLPEMTCGFLIQMVFCKKKTMWFIGVEVEQETSAPPPKINPGSAPGCSGEITRLPPTYVACVQIPASTPCGLSLLLVLFFATRGFSLGTPVFPSPQKPTLPTSNSIWNARTRFNEFLRSPKCSIVKQITKLQNYYFQCL